MTAILLVSSLVACSQERKPENPEVPEPLPDQPIREPTFEAILSPSELMDILRANLPSPVDTPEEIQAIAEIQQELSRYRYVPSPEVKIRGPEAPMGESFAADVAMMYERIPKMYSGTLMVSCVADPCINYGDFDGDGRNDMVVQVLTKGNYLGGVVFFLANGMHAVLGAGRASEVGNDLIWMMAWKVVLAGAENGKAAALILEGSMEQVLVQLGAPRGDGSVEVAARWLVSPPPPMD